MKNPTAPILAAILLLLPVLYVASYFALVMPGTGGLAMTSGGRCRQVARYRVGGDCCRQVFWPLEQVDRQFQLRAWQAEAG